MTGTKTFTHHDAGVIFDGALGQTHNDARVIAMAIELGYEADEDTLGAVAAALDGSELGLTDEQADILADQAGHNGAAVEYLNDRATDETCTFEWVDGDFRLSAIDDYVSGVFTLEIALDGAALQDDPNAEVARILRKLAGRIESPISLSGSESLMDVNGNTVGTWWVKDND